MMASQKYWFRKNSCKLCRERARKYLDKDDCYFSVDQSSRSDVFSPNQCRLTLWL